MSLSVNGVTNVNNYKCSKSQNRQTVGPVLHLWLSEDLHIRMHKSEICIRSP